MCGIAGFIGGTAARSGPEILRAMTDAIAHRGPDDEGSWFDADRGVALGHRRLSVLDVSERGRQPMLSPGGRYVVTYNGEIYNYRELRRDLEGEGVTFRTGTDTEVLLAAVETWELEPALDRCLGMFAFALWDRSRHRLTLARDRLGIKPLYFAQCGNAFLFASELAALVPHPDFDSELNPAAVHAFLRDGVVSAPDTIYQGARSLLPGCLLELDPDHPESAESRAYWSPPGDRECPPPPFAGTESEAVAELETILRESVRARMVSDVPLGAFLSGGVDSSLVVALMREVSTETVRTFSVVHPDPRYDESESARAVARHLGVDHHDVHLDEETVLTAARDMPRMYSEPFADSSQIPTALVSRFARNHVTVAMSGDGGDELFGGYNRYLWGSRLWRRVGSVPRPFRNMAAGVLELTPEAWVEQVARSLPSRSGGGVRLPAEKARKLARLLRAEDRTGAYRSIMAQCQRPEDLLLDPAIPRADEFPVAEEFAEAMMQYDLRTYLPNDILVKVDRASMAVGLEARVPLLDHRVVDFAHTLPLAWKIKGGVGKGILRQVLHRHVPRDLVDRPKMGFAVPLGDWLRGPLRPWAEDLLSAQSLRRPGILRSEKVAAMWAEHLSGRRDHSGALWCVLMLQGWLRTGTY